MKHLPSPFANRAKRSRVVLVVVLLVLLIGSVAYVRNQYYQALQPLSASQRSQLVTIELGSTASQIAQQLEQAELIKKRWAFEWYVRNNNLRDKLQAGSYYLRPSQSIQEITTILTQGKVATDLITILPGQRLDQIRQSFIRSGFDTDAVDQALDPRLYKMHAVLADKPVNANLEGYLYPESFQVHTNTEPSEIITASLDEMQKRLSPQVRAGFVKQGLTVHQGVILASIVGQEVGKVDDKARVAQVFLLRLKSGIALESDATAGYGAILDGKQPSLKYRSAYNTYQNKGLTPGPVGNVTESSLQAVANPSATDYLFFVAGDDGVTYFSHTIEQHEALTAQHCKKLCN